MTEILPAQQRHQQYSNALMSPAFLREVQRAVPRDVQADRIVRTCLTAARANPKLFECSWESVAMAVLQCAATGLEPGPLGQVALVPYGKQCQWIPMYKGLLHLAYRNEGIEGVQAEVVYSNDHFEFDEGSEPFVRFRRPLDPEIQRGKPIAAFAAVRPHGARYPLLRVMRYDELEDIRKRYSRGKRDDAPWVVEWDEMAIKTVLRRCLKRAPLTPEMSRTLNWDDARETGKPIEIEVNPPTEKECSDSAAEQQGQEED